MCAPLRYATRCSAWAIFPIIVSLCRVPPVLSRMSVTIPPRDERSTVGWTFVWCRKQVFAGRQAWRLGERLDDGAEINRIVDTEISLINEEPAIYSPANDSREEQSCVTKIVVAALKLMNTTLTET
ncbi:hypothetical protein PflSS101_1483 [Pseudomonas lactis]|uniref:Uncharacterized protein n=1 Tax=Pseudomonas lactis TaxID=1615674 RepID=I4KFW8_9PSED|nr:hypothetical protein PflSS101_1483 [Pseudomonas lactis]